MLPKRRRISRQLFPENPYVGRVLHSPHLSFRGSLSPHKVARIAVVISKKIAARSVDRHLLKRRMYDTIARTERSYPLPPGKYVFFAKKDAPSVSYSTLYEEVLRLVREMRSIVKTDTLV